MLTVKTQIMYEDAKRCFELDVLVKKSLKGVSFLNAVEKAVEKKMKRMSEEDPSLNDWIRWNMI